MDRILEENIKVYKEKLNILSERLKLGAENGELDGNFSQELESLKKMRDVLLSDILPIYREKRIKDTDVTFERCEVKGGFTPSGFVVENMKLDDENFVVITSKNEVAEYMLEGGVLIWSGKKETERIGDEEVFLIGDRKIAMNRFSILSGSEGVVENKIAGKNTYIEISEEGKIFIFEECGGILHRNKKEIDGFFTGGCNVENDMYIVFDLENNAYIININVVDTVEKMYKEGVLT